MAERNSGQSQGRGRGLGGYDADFCPSLDRKYVCPVCLAALREPMQTACGHRFCRNCIMGVAGGRRVAKCPVDNVLFGVETELFEDNAFRREISSLTVRCDNASEGCTWRGELRALEGHKKDCLFVMVECIHGCGTSVLLIRYADEHVQSCERRPTTCEHCRTTIPFADMTKHQVLMCQNLPVQCTSCGKGGILRKDISKHIDATTGDCPCTIIQCQYASFGCQFQSLRKLMPDHLKEATNQHVLLLVRRVTDLEQQLSTLESKMAVVENDQSQINRTLTDRVEPATNYIFEQYLSGTFLWKIALPTGILRSETCTFVSPFFYSAYPGHKMCAMLGLNNVDKPEGKWSSFFLVFQKGMYDSELSFSNSSNFMNVKLLDQSGGVRSQDYGCSIFCNSISLGPEDGASIRRGINEFRLTEDLYSQRYMKDGCIQLLISQSPQRPGSQDD